MKGIEGKLAQGLVSGAKIFSKSNKLVVVCGHKKKNMGVKKRLLRFGDKEMLGNFWYVFSQADPKAHIELFLNNLSLIFRSGIFGTIRCLRSQSSV